MHSRDESFEVKVVRSFVRGSGTENIGVTYVTAFEADHTYVEFLSVGCMCDVKSRCFKGDGTRNFSQRPSRGAREIPPALSLARRAPTGGPPRPRRAAPASPPLIGSRGESGARPSKPRATGRRTPRRRRLTPHWRGGARPRSRRRDRGPNATALSTHPPPPTFAGG